MLRKLLSHIRPVSKFRPGELTIFMYHGVVNSPLPISNSCFVTASRFESQLEALRQRCNLLPLEEALDALSQGRLRAPAAVITFDDGYHNNYEIAFPILSRLSIPATIFLTTGYVDSDEAPWADQLQHQLTVTREKKLIWEGKTYPITSRRLKSAALLNLTAALKQRPHAELLEAVDGIRAKLGILAPTTFALDSPFRILTRSAIAEMAASGLVSFGAHTVSHAILSRLDPAAARSEIVDSIGAVAAFTGRPCSLFAYPNGTRRDYDDAALKILRETTVKWALTARPGVNTKTTPVFEVRRLPPAHPSRILQKWGLATDRKLGEGRRDRRRD